MKYRIFKKRRGSLMQTLFLCILMATISMFIFKWLLLRFQQSIRLSNSVATKTRTEGVFNNMMSVWSSTNTPPDGDYYMVVSDPSKNVNVKVNVSGNEIKITANED